MTSFNDLMANLDNENDNSIILKKQEQHNYEPLFTIDFTHYKLDSDSADSDSANSSEISFGNESETKTKAKKESKETKQKPVEPILNYVEYNESKPIFYLDNTKTYGLKKPLGKYQLKLHQLTSLHYMLNLEKNYYSCKTITRNENTGSIETALTNHYTNIGILGDQVGSGKSYSIMGLISEAKQVKHNYIPMRHLEVGSINITIPKINQLDTNLLVVPHSLVEQWTGYLAGSGLKYYIIKTMKDIYNLADDKCLLKTTSASTSTNSKTKKTTAKKDKKKVDVKVDEVVNEVKEEKAPAKLKLKLKTKKSKNDDVDASNSGVPVETITKPEEDLITKHIKKLDLESFSLTDLCQKKQTLNIEIREIDEQLRTLRHTDYYSRDYKKVDELNKKQYEKEREIRQINQQIYLNDILKGKISLGDLNDIIHHFKYNYYKYIPDKLQAYLDIIGNINKSLAESHDVILITESFYNNFAIYLLKDNYTINRLIVDECNSIKISKMATIKASFTWLITSSIKSILTNDGITYTREHVSSQYGGYYHNRREKSIMSSGHILDTITKMYNNFDENFKVYLVNNPEYINQSNKLPAMTVIVIACKNNANIQVLQGVVSQDVLAMLNAGDIEGVVSKLNIVMNDESNLIEMITQKYRDELKIKEYEIKIYMEHPKYNPSAKNEALVNKREDVKQLQTKIASIEERVKNVENCPICYDDFSNPIITPCCNNKYCFGCITTALGHKKDCPTCRTKISIETLLIVGKKKDDEEQKGKKGKNKSNDDVDNDDEEYLDYKNMTYDDKIKLIQQKSKEMTKYENLDKICELNNSNPVRKYIIFTEYDNSINDKVITVLDKWGLKYGRIKGTTSTIAKEIKNYKTGDTNVLLINSRFFGSGLNLENTTDIIILHKMNSDVEMQAIGRAQRFGRVGNLRVWKLYYENEIEN